MDSQDDWTRSNVTTSEPVTQSLADIKPTAVQWLWRGLIPKGKVSILEGDPDLGKSAITLDWTAIVTTGREWPLTKIDGQFQPRDSADPAGVILVGVEDDYEDTVVPRLDAAGADRTRVYMIVQPRDEKGQPKPFVIPDDVDRLRQAVEETNAALIVIDPITAFLSTAQVKAGDDPSTRQALMPLVELARETGCAILMLRHLNKSTGMSAKHRGSGTMAFTGIARSVIVAGKLKEPNGRATHAIALTKGNLSKHPQAIGYRIECADDNPDAPAVFWCGPVDLDADQLIGADGAKVGDARKNAPAKQEAMELMAELLADGPMKMAEVEQKIKANTGCGIKPIREAAKQLRVVKKAIRMNGQVDHWTWELPPKKLRLKQVEESDETLDTPDP
jgi:hypothetical protein